MVVRLCLSLLLLLSVPGLAAAETIDLVRQGGVFMVPVRINDAVTIPFVLDSGAGDVSLPEDVFKTLLRTGTVKSDVLSPGTYINADGMALPGQRFMLHELRVGDHVIRDIVASVAPDNASPLLGQSFLGKLPGWSIDNTRHALVIGAGGEGERQAALPVPPQPTALAPTKPPLLGDGVAAYQRGDYATAASIFRSLAEQGDAVAQSWLGNLYRKGQGVARDYAEAARWYRKAADQGEATAQTSLGFLFAHGQGVAQDYSQAELWYREAAKQGEAVAKNNLGDLYSQGVAPEYGEAARWYRKAAEQGDATAQTNLGSLYAQGRGVARDYTQAVRWLRKGAEQGDATAQNNLGFLYQNGQGVARDYAEAARWYRKAAKQGDATARDNLARLTGASPRR